MGKAITNVLIAFFALKRDLQFFMASGALFQALVEPFINEFVDLSDFFEYLKIIQIPSNVLYKLFRS